MTREEIFAAIEFDRIQCSEVFECEYFDEWSEPDEAWGAPTEQNFCECTGGSKCCPRVDAEIEDAGEQDDI